MKWKFENGSEFYPLNGDSIGLRMSFEEDYYENEITADRVELGTEAYSFVRNHIQNGGIFKGIPIQIEMLGETIEMMINLTKSPRFTDSKCEVTIEKRKATSRFSTQAEGLSFESLFAKGGFQPGDFFDTPYVIVPDNQLMFGIILILAIFNAAKELGQAIRDIGEVTSESANPLNVAVFVIQTVLQILYLIFIIAALIKLFTDLIQLAFPKVRYFSVSKIKTLIQRGCEYLGYQFSSTLLDSLPGLTLLPVPITNTNQSIFQQLLSLSNQSFTKGYPTANDTTPTLLSLINEMKTAFNARGRVVGNTFHLEGRNYWASLASQSIISTLTSQEERENVWSYNFDEVFKRYFVTYRYDTSDIHTLDALDRFDAEYETQPIGAGDMDLETIEGYRPVKLGFSYAKRKNSLNFIEGAIADLAMYADYVIGYLGGNSNLAAPINARVGVTQISSQIFTVSKLMYTINGKQPADYLDYIGAPAIYQNHHAINEVDVNFRKVVEGEIIPFSRQNYVNLMQNNFVTDQLSRQLEILTIDFIPKMVQATIKYKTDPELNTNTETITING